MRKKTIRSIVVWGVLISALIGAGYRYRHPFYAHATNGIAFCAYPFIRAQSYLLSCVTAVLERRRSEAELRLKCDLLHKRCEQLLAENIELAAQQEYCADIHELIAFKKRYAPDTGRVAQVLVRQFTNDAHIFLVNAGAVDGVEPDMTVIYNDCLIGRICDVYPYYSRVRLITDPITKIAACTAQSGAHGIHEGAHEVGKTTLRYVSHLEHIKSGELILSSGEGLVFPRGFGLGRIAHMTQEGLFYHIDVEPLCDLTSITHCLILPHQAKAETIS